MKRALCMLRTSLHYRRDAFCAGLQAVGFQVVPEIRSPDPDDLICIWNRYSGYHEQARRFEDAGARVLVAENGYLGKGWRGGDWYAMALGHHAGAGQWRDGGPQRWDALGVEFEPWRDGGTETLILGQRGIGEPGVASPPKWAEKAQRMVGGRIRPHPGKEKAGVPLAEDLARARCVVTWHSGAALLALMMGVPVFHDFPQWIGAPAARPLSEFSLGPRMDDADRLSAFRRLAWAQWRLDEIRTGEAFHWLLNSPTSTSAA